MLITKKYVIEVVLDEEGCTIDDSTLKSDIQMCLDVGFETRPEDVLPGVLQIQLYDEGVLS